MVKKVKILLIEDDAALIDMYSIRFQDEGFDVVTATNGIEGIAQATKGDFDVILLDIIMPKMDGFSVLRELRSISSLSTTPILMLTNLGQKSDIEKSKEYGASDYIVKSSATPTQIVNQIKQYL